MFVRRSLPLVALLLLAIPVWAQQPTPPAAKPADTKPATPAPAPVKPADTKPATPAATPAKPADTIPAMTSKGAEVGKTAPDFMGKDLDGKDVKLADFKGKIVVLEWVNMDCPVCQRHVKAKTASNTMTKFAGKPVVWLGVDSTKTADANKDKIKTWAKDGGLTFPTILDGSGKIGKAYGAQTTPHVFVIDKDGKLAYSGAIDDDPDGKGAKTNYAEAAVNSLLAGSAVATTTTKPYGCSVKYAQ